MSPPTDQPPPGPRRRGLTVFGKIDFCRGLFAILVVLCHGFTAAWAMDPHAPATLTPELYDWLLDSVGAGFYWVMGFFVLSGYCIHLSVDRQVREGRFALGPYLIARATRILPLYYLAFAFAIAARALASILTTGTSDALDDRPVLIAQLFVVHNLIRCYPGFVASWSITNEAAYYVLYGLLAVVAAGRRGLPVRVGLAVCILGGGVFQIIYSSGEHANFILRTGLLFGLGVNWFLGVLVAVERDQIRRSALIQILARLWPVGLLSAIWSFHRGGPIQLSYILSGIAFTGLMIRITASAMSDEPVDEPGWARRLVGFLGLMSYPTYLFHAPWQALLAAALPWLGWQADWRITWVLMTGSSLLLGAVLGVALERPIMRWRGDLLTRLRERAAVQTATPRCETIGLTPIQRITGS